MQGVTVKKKVVSVSDFHFTGKVLGKGNFARVEEAVHSVLNVKVAVKIIDVSEIKEKYVLKNLHREARIMSMLNHPCITALFQTMQLTDNIYYLVTELVGGGDLCSFIMGQRFGKLDEQKARVYARQFVSALSHMQSFGIVHRDLKMENVMLNAAQSQIKIVDFGLSNVYSSDNPLRTHCGSPEYAAPELFVAGKEYGPEVDLWSLGIILYGMVVGRLPFVSNKTANITSQERRKKLVAQINKGLATAQRQVLAFLTVDFRAMIYKLLMVDAKKRITVKELLTHPWISERGKRVIRINPIKKLDPDIHGKFTKQIAAKIDMSAKKVATEICRNPYGRFGGMLNILNFRLSVDQFNPDMLVKTVQKRQVEALDLMTHSHLPVRSEDLYNQCVVLLNRISKDEGFTKERAKTAGPVMRSTPKSKGLDGTDGVRPTKISAIPRMVITSKKMQQSPTTDGSSALMTRKSARIQSAQGFNEKLRTKPTVSSVPTRQRPSTGGTPIQNKSLKRTSTRLQTASTSNSTHKATSSLGEKSSGDGRHPYKKKRTFKCCCCETEREGTTAQ